MTDIAKIKKAAAELDKHDPDWYNKIDLDTLDLRSGEKCILGQLVRWGKGEDSDLCHSDHPLYLKFDDEMNCYFEALDSSSDTKMWIPEIESRRGKGNIVIKYNGLQTTIQVSDIDFLTRVMKDLKIEGVTIIEEKPLF